MDYATMFRLDGKVALVTGGGRGLGRAIAEGMAVSGAAVAIADLDRARAEQAAAELTAQGHRTLALHADVTQRDSVDAMIQGVLDAFGGLDVLVSNAGITINHPTVEFPEDDYDRVMVVNLKGVFLCAQAAARAMIAVGRGGRIVNIGSISGVIAEHPRTSPYAASKAGVIQFTKNWALEWAEHGINVNAIGPGYIRTEMTAPHLANPELVEQIRRKTILGRVAEPSEMVGAIVYLSSPAATYVTGHTLFVDGGWLAQ